MKKLMIATVAGLLALSACTDTVEYNNTVVENVQEPDANTAGPCGDGTFPKGNEHCK